MRSNTSFRQIAASLALRSISLKRAERILEAQNETLCAEERNSLEPPAVRAMQAD